METQRPWQGSMNNGDRFFDPPGLDSGLVAPDTIPRSCAPTKWMISDSSCLKQIRQISEGSTGGVSQISTTDGSSLSEWSSSPDERLPSFWNNVDFSPPPGLSDADYSSHSVQPPPLSPAQCRLLEETLATPDYDAHGPSDYSRAGNSVLQVNKMNPRRQRGTQASSGKQSAAAFRGIQHSDDSDDSVRKGHTKVLVSGLPRQCTAQEWLDTLKDAGFRRCDVASLDLPMRTRTGLNSGCCTINFVDVATTRAFTASFHGRVLRSCGATIAVRPFEFQLEQMSSPNANHFNGDSDARNSNAQRILLQQLGQMMKQPAPTPNPAQFNVEVVHERMSF